MPQSANLKSLKSTWAHNCQSMWSELLSVIISESYVISNYASIPKTTLLTHLFYCPELEPRLGDLRKDTFIERAQRFKNTIITNRIVFLSAAFETYFRGFLDDYLRSKPSLFDKAANSRTAKGDKLFGDTMKVRGMVEKIEEFAVLSGRSTKAFNGSLPYMRDLYILRNAMAHEAGFIDTQRSSHLACIKVIPGQAISLRSEDVIDLAKHTMLVAEGLDVKLTTKKS